jgi:transketolase
MKRELPASWMEIFQTYKKKLAETKPNEATRKSSENTLEVLVPAIPEMIGGSADLTGSNNTKTKAMKPVQAGDYHGNYIY